MTTDPYMGAGQDLLGPAVNVETVTPSNTTALAYTSKRLYVGAGGNVAVVTQGGQTVLYSNVQTGTYLSVRATQVNATSTTASSILAEY